MAAEKVRLASVGLGGWGEALADAAGRCGAVEIVRCYARTGDTRKAFSEKYGCRPAERLEEILGDDAVEGILVSTPHSTHADIIVQAASAGKHVFVEKPFTLTVEDGKRAIAAASKAGVVLQVGHNRRRMGATRRIKEMIDRGELGMVHQLEANLSRPGGQNPRPGWRNDPAECPVGAMTGLGVHMVDNLHYFAGPVKRLCAFSKKLLGRTNLDDVTSVVFEFESGPLGYLGTTYVIPGLYNVAAFGTEASAWSEEDGAKFYLQTKDEEARRNLPVEAGDSLADEVAEFARCIRGGGAPETGGPEGLEVVAVLEAVIESVKSGRVVEVSPFRG